LAGDMATRCSPGLISDGIPIITQFSLNWLNYFFCISFEIEALL
jgi:hypothetical protein